MNDPILTGSRGIQSDVLQVEWEALLGRLASYGNVLRATSQVEADAVGVIWMRCHAEHLSEVDRKLLECQMVEPQYREAADDQTVIMVKFRSWWRKSVPFLMDTEGAKHHYRFSVLDAENGPGEEG